MGNSDHGTTYTIMETRSSWADLAPWEILEWISLVGIFMALKSSTATCVFWP